MSLPLMDSELISVCLNEKKAGIGVFQSSVIADSILWLRYVDNEVWQVSKSLFKFFFSEIRLKERHHELTEYVSFY